MWRLWWRRGGRHLVPSCTSYNNDEGIGDNHYNCPVVAYYPELLAANVPSLSRPASWTPMWACGGTRIFIKRISSFHGRGVPYSQAGDPHGRPGGDTAYENYMHVVRETGREYIEYARVHDMPILVLCGRPYHIDPEINHGINDLITSFGFVLVTEDALSYLEGLRPPESPQPVDLPEPDVQRRPLCLHPGGHAGHPAVSFGCGTDAITTDELRDILEEGGKLYTQLKIDGISNLGAVDHPQPLLDGRHRGPEGPAVNPTPWKGSKLWLN